MQKQPLDELLKTYKIKLKVSLEILDERRTEVQKSEIRIKIGLYREFIHELEEVIKS